MAYPGASRPPSHPTLHSDSIEPSATWGSSVQPNVPPSTVFSYSSWPSVRGRQARKAHLRRHQEAETNSCRRRVTSPWPRIRPEPTSFGPRDNAAREGAAPSRGDRYLHHTVDDYSRVAYAKTLDDEKKYTAAGFWRRANAFFNSIGVTVTAVINTNCACYRSGEFKNSPGKKIKHKCTKARRPQTNVTAERFNCTRMREWSYAKPDASEAEREASYEDSFTTRITTAPTPLSRARPPLPALTTSQGSTP